VIATTVQDQPGPRAYGYRAGRTPSNRIDAVQLTRAWPDAGLLTPRERDVLQLAAHDLSGSGIAVRLGVSTATVRTHFEHIYAKLGVRSRGGAVAAGLRMGLII
jgi:DNA-binding CsgD family transcriptional regulator